MTTPSGIVNRSLDFLGRTDLTIGELGEGTEAAKPALRAYGPALRQLLRAAHWGFARQQAPLTLLADATGQTPNVGTVVPAPWTYEYALPTDCLKFRFLPWNSNPVSANPPTMTGLNQPPLNAVRLVPAPFLMASDYNYPVTQGSTPEPDWSGINGVGPINRTVILTNVPPQPQGSNPTIFPSGVYTYFVAYPSQWDSLFEEALVQYLAQKLAMALVADKKLALSLRNSSISAVKDMIVQARAINANEAGAPQSISRLASWSRARNAASGWWWGNGGTDGGYNGPGMLLNGADSLGFSDGSVF